MLRLNLLNQVNEKQNPPAALFLEQLGAIYPKWQHFLRAVNGRFPVAVYDRSKPYAEQVQGVQVVVDDGGTNSTPDKIDGAIAAGVKLWHVTTNGLDHVNVAYFLEKGMPLAHAAGPQSAIALAEHALTVILYFAKNLHRNNARTWTVRVPNIELEQQVLGLIGLGASARELARRARFLGMRVMAVDRVPVPAGVRDELGVEFLGGPEHLIEMAAQADFLSAHVPLTTKTRHMIDHRVLQAMKPTAVIINVARGPVIDEEALIEALRTDKLKGAGVDVYGQEPLPSEHPFLHLPNVLATPHIAGVTNGTFRRRAEAAVLNVERVLQGLPPLDLVVARE